MQFIIKEYFYQIIPIIILTSWYCFEKTHTTKMASLVIWHKQINVLSILVYLFYQDISDLSAKCPDLGWMVEDVNQCLPLELSVWTKAVFHCNISVTFAGDPIPRLYTLCFLCEFYNFSQQIFIILLFLNNTSFENIYTNWSIWKYIYQFYSSLCVV